MVASKTLAIFMRMSIQKIRRTDSLLGIISRVSEDAWIYTTLNAVSASYHHPIFVRMNKLVIEQKFPDGVHELAATMSYYILLLRSPFLMKSGSKILERIWKRRDVCDVLASA
jgi:hypothetical protein